MGLITENAYFTRRALESQKAAECAKGSSATNIHRQLARAYAQLAVEHSVVQPNEPRGGAEQRPALSFLLRSLPPQRADFANDDAPIQPEGALP
jgi:hypothetical protein